MKSKGGDRERGGRFRPPGSLRTSVEQRLHRTPIRCLRRGAVVLRIVVDQEGPAVWIGGAGEGFEQPKDILLTVVGYDQNVHQRRRCSHFRF